VQKRSRYVCTSIPAFFSHLPRSKVVTYLDQSPHLRRLDSLSISWRPSGPRALRRPPPSSAKHGPWLSVEEMWSPLRKLGQEKPFPSLFLLCSISMRKPFLWKLIHSHWHIGNPFLHRVMVPLLLFLPPLVNLPFKSNRNARSLGTFSIVARTRGLTATTVPTRAYVTLRFTEVLPRALRSVICNEASRS